MESNLFYIYILLDFLENTKKLDIFDSKVQL